MHEERSREKTVPVFKDPPKRAIGSAENLLPAISSDPRGTGTGHRNAPNAAPPTRRVDVAGDPIGHPPIHTGCLAIPNIRRSKRNPAQAQRRKLPHESAAVDPVRNRLLPPRNWW